MTSIPAGENKPGEIPLSSVLQIICNDEELSDLTLVGTDGKRVRTNRCVLAARSDVFRKMLFGKYREGLLASVQLGYDGNILQAVTDYCFTDHSPMFDEKDCDDAWGRTMVQIVAASDYFALPELGKKVFDIACKRMAKEPALSCSIVDEADTVSGAAHDLGRFALNVIRSKPQEALFSSESSQLNGVLTLKSTTLSLILQDSELDIDEFSLFRAVALWSGPEGSETGDWTELGSTQSRRDTAAELATYIQLDRIKPSDLCSTVIPSGLVAPDRLAETFKEQAILFEKRNVSIRTKRLPCWKDSNDTIIAANESCITSSLLDCEPMTSGVHTWSIEIQEISSKKNWYDEIGIAQSINNEDEWITSVNNKGWACETRGMSYHASNKLIFNGCEATKFGKGNIITFTLDLTMNGTLTLSVDGKDLCTLFDNIVSQVDVTEKFSFRPAVSLYYPAAVRFLGFKDYNEIV